MILVLKYEYMIRWRLKRLRSEPISHLKENQNRIHEIYLEYVSTVVIKFLFCFRSTKFWLFIGFIFEPFPKNSFITDIFL